MVKTSYGVQSTGRAIGGVLFGERGRGALAVRPGGGPVVVDGENTEASVIAVVLLRAFTNPCPGLSRGKTVPWWW